MEPMIIGANRPLKLAGCRRLCRGRFRPVASPEAFDGIVRPRRGQWTPLRSESPWPARTVIDRSGPQTDLDAIRIWSRS